MSKPGPSARKKSARTESFGIGITTLSEEIKFAVEWRRPSILLALCESDLARAEAELALERQLAQIGQAIVRFAVDEKQFDVPLLLSQRSDRERSVYSVSGLSGGGGEKGANAYRALNIRREYFVDYSIRAVFWLTKKETVALSRLAPDFWAFRHRLVEFGAPPRPRRTAPPAEKSIPRAQKRPTSAKKLAEEIAGLESRLANVPKESLAKRLDLLYKLADRYQEKGEYEQAAQRLQEGIEFARQVEGADLLARFWSRLGLVYQALDQPTRAIQAHRKAIRLTPEDAGRWVGLGQAYLAQGRAETARSAFRKAIKFNPQDALAWAGLGEAHHSLGRNEAALKAYRRAVQFAPQNADIWNNLALVYRSEKQFADAIIAYRQALALDAHNPTAHASLVACYRLSEENALAQKQIKLAQSVMKKTSEYHQAILESVCGNAGKAIGLLTIALEKKQIAMDRLEPDPNLDFVRNDPRFSRLREEGPKRAGSS